MNLKVEHDALRRVKGHEPKKYGKSGLTLSTAHNELCSDSILFHISAAYFMQESKKLLGLALVLGKTGKDSSSNDSCLQLQPECINLARKCQRRTFDKNAPGTVIKWPEYRLYMKLLPKTLNQICETYWCRN